MPRFWLFELVGLAPIPPATKNIAFGVAVFFSLAAIVIPILGALRGHRPTDTRDK
jgi:hypothetical protein